MKTVVPAYYDSFRCRADKCEHTCCVGWEIGVDDETFRMYTETESDFAKYISEKIVSDTDGHRFKTDENKKCPFLLGNGLCDIVLKNGEGWLCDICRDHPRFRNYFSTRVETGLGMCCEEATRLILCADDTSLVVSGPDDDLSDCDEEKRFFDERQWIFECIKNGNTSYDIIKRISEKYSFRLSGESPQYWYDFLSELECMDESRDKYFKYLKKSTEFIMPFEKEDIRAYKNILHYYVYRHLPKIFDGYSMETCLSFCFLCANIIIHIYLNSEIKDLELLSDIARVFSVEIEYSEENTEGMIGEVDFCIHSSEI